jgi:hypothetical protein
VAPLREVGVPACVLQGRPPNWGAAFTRTRVRSCRNAITMASVMVDEIRLRVPAHPIISDDDT